MIFAQQNKKKQKNTEVHKLNKIGFFKQRKKQPEKKICQNRVECRGENCQFKTPQIQQKHT